MQLLEMRFNNQLLSGPQAANPGEVVRRLIAVQSQDFNGAKWALGIRIKNSRENTIDRAFDRGEILRTHVLRPTWHFVSSEDISWLLTLTSPRIHLRNQAMLKNLGLDKDLLLKAADRITRVLEGGNFLTRNELNLALHRSGITPASHLHMTYFVMFAELEGLICSGPRRGNQFSYALLAERAPHTIKLNRTEALAELVEHYFSTRGPANVQDFTHWSGLTVVDAEIGLKNSKTALISEKYHNHTYWYSQAHSTTTAPLPTVLLLSFFDEIFSSYMDRWSITTSEIKQKISALGNGLSYLIMINGQVAGTWKRILKSEKVSVDIHPFCEFSHGENLAVIQALKNYAGFLNRRLIYINPEFARLAEDYDYPSI